MAKDAKKAVKPTKVLSGGDKGVPARLKRIYTQNADKSLLLRLPPELRTRIWTLVLCGNTIHLPSKHHYYLRVCRASVEEAAEVEQIRASATTFDIDPYVETHAECFRAFYLHVGPRLNTAVLGVCRQIHEEAALLPFSGNTFAAEGLHRLAHFAQHLLLEQARAISHVIVHNEEGYAHKTKTLCKTLTTRLCGIKKLTVFAVANTLEFSYPPGGFDKVKACEYLAGCLKSIQIADVSVVGYACEDIDVFSAYSRTKGPSAMEFREWEAGVEKEFHDACREGADA